MKRLFAMILALALAAGLISVSTAEEAPSLTDYGDCDTPYEILSSAESALADGKDGKWVLQQMQTAASLAGVEDMFKYMCENIAAYGNEEYQKMQKAIEARETSWTLDVTPPYGFSDIYDRASVSDALAEVLRDKNAHYCIEPTYWKEDEFKSVFGTEYSKFKPKNPRAGFVCVIIKKGTQDEPEKTFNHDAYRDFMRELDSAVGNACGWLHEDEPVLTGNPNLASTFWVFSMKYPFHGYYGENREVKGYNCEVSLTAVKADGHSEVASISASNKLGNTIYSWSDGVSAADAPSLSNPPSMNPSSASWPSPCARSAAPPRPTAPSPPATPENPSRTS